MQDRYWHRTAGRVTMGMTLILAAAWLASYFADCNLALGDVQLTSNSGTMEIIYSFPPDPTSYTSHLGYWVIPYWAVVIPLTLVSASLILWKPRQSLSPINL